MDQHVGQRTFFLGSIIATVCDNNIVLKREGRLGSCDAVIPPLLLHGRVQIKTHIQNFICSVSTKLLTVSKWWIICLCVCETLMLTRLPNKGYTIACANHVCTCYGWCSTLIIINIVFQKQMEQLCVFGTVNCRGYKR